MGILASVATRDMEVFAYRGTGLFDDNYSGPATGHGLFTGNSSDLLQGAKSRNYSSDWLRETISGDWPGQPI